MILSSISMRVSIRERYHRQFSSSMLVQLWKLEASVVPSPVPDQGNCSFVALNVTVYNDDSYDRMCKTRRDITSYIQNHFDIAKKPWSNLLFASEASKEALIQQHHFCRERVGEEHHGDDNTVHISQQWRS